MQFVFRSFAEHKAAATWVLSLKLNHSRMGISAKELCLRRCRHRAMMADHVPASIGQFSETSIAFFTVMINHLSIDRRRSTAMLDLLWGFTAFLAIIAAPWPAASGQTKA